MANWVANRAISMWVTGEVNDDRILGGWSSSGIKGSRKWRVSL